jgi:hypothetical protein
MSERSPSRNVAASPIRKRLWVAILGSLLMIGLVMGTLSTSSFAGILPDRLPKRLPSDERIPIGVLGDSDSQGYEDMIRIPRNAQNRGGIYRDISLQWNEVLASLRPSEVDLGDVGVWGGRRSVVRFLEAFGFLRRAPRKFDHQYNFAFSGARSKDLIAGPYRQVQRLMNLMDQEPERWKRGVVIIRIGIMDLSGYDNLDAMARDPDSADLILKIESCAANIAKAVGMLRARHPETRILLIGILDDSDLPSFFDRWRDAHELANIASGLNRFDDALRSLAASDTMVAFFDDRAWFRAHWGSRDGKGAPNYKVVSVGSSIKVAHAIGDAPTNSILADGHAGLVWNTLWCQSIVDVLSSRMKLPIRPIASIEVERFLESQFKKAELLQVQPR